MHAYLPAILAVLLSLPLLSYSQTVSSDCTTCPDESSPLFEGIAVEEVVVGMNGNGGGDGSNSNPYLQPSPAIRKKAELIKSECSAINKLYNSSYNYNGSFWRENSAWITEAGVILLPNDKNLDDISFNDALPVDYREEKPHVYYNGKWLEIYGHVHTQPDHALPGTADWDAVDDFANDITGFIFSPNEVYRYQDKDGESYTQKRVPNVYNFMNCEKSFSDYYY